MSDVSRIVDSVIDDYSSERASLAHLLCDRHNPDTIAYSVARGDDITAVTYGQLRRESTRLAHGLRAIGIAPGDRVATLLGKGAELVTTMLAVWRIGAVYVPLFTAFASSAVGFRLRTSDTKLVLTEASQRKKLLPEDGASEPSWQVLMLGEGGEPGDLRYEDVLMAGSDEPLAPHVQGPDGPIVHIFTSGTTGSPKGVIHPLRYAASWETYLRIGIGVEPGDVFWCAADPGWAYGLYTAIVAPLAAGIGTVLQVGNFSPAASWELLVRLSVTNFTAAPTVYRAMRTCAPASIEGLRLERLSSAGEPLTPDVNEWTSAILGLEVRDHYGQTEVGMIFANHHHPELARPVVPGSMGQPLPGWSAAVLAQHADEVLAPGLVGRIAIDTRTSPMMTFTDYQDGFGAATRFTEDGQYYVLGDIGSVDEGGSYRFSSRDDDVIIMAGYRIGPFEIESVISQHPAVSECAVVSAPDAVRGEVLEAYVVLGEGVVDTEACAREIQDLVRTKYAAHAYPRVVHIVEQLPKTPSGKVQRYVLREQRRRELMVEP